MDIDESGRVYKFCLNCGEIGYISRHQTICPRVGCRGELVTDEDEFESRRVASFDIDDLDNYNYIGGYQTSVELLNDDNECNYSHELLDRLSYGIDSTTGELSINDIEFKKDILSDIQRLADILRSEFKRNAKVLEDIKSIRTEMIKKLDDFKEDLFIEFKNIQLSEKRE